VRHLGRAARVEIAPEELAGIEERRQAVVAAVAAAGYETVTIETYRRGRLNEALRILDPSGVAR
jgi:PP-loop superfamily ATP-utilizing enzyme